MKRDRLKQKLIRLGGIAFLIYIVFMVGKTVYQNFKFNKIVKNLEIEVEVLEAENMNLNNKILYYKTDSYKERVMRERLQYQKPGEQVLAIKTNDEDNQKKEDTKPKLSNLQKWWQFLFPEKKEI